MWNEVITNTVKFLQEKEARTKKHVKANVQAANDSQTRMESRYDTYREEYSMKAAAIGGSLDDLKFLQGFLAGLLTETKERVTKIMLGSVVEVDYGDNDRELILLLPCHGGDIVKTSQGDVLLISIDSPLGQAIKDHEVGEEVAYETNDHKITIKIISIYREQ
jgi:transcription elongation GreA/GreB family factor